MSNIISERGSTSTEWQLLAIIGIVLGIILIIVGWLFQEKLLDIVISVFILVGGWAKDSICDVFGVFGQTIGKLYGC